MPRISAVLAPFAVVAAVACAGPARQSGPGIVVPLSIAEGHNPGAKRRGSLTAPASAPGSAASSSSVPTPAGSAAPGEPPTETAPSPKDHGSQPDPVPLVTAHQWQLSLHYAKGTVKFEGAKPVELPAPAPTPRQIGRFAVELWVGRELVDRVRFDFPLLGAEGPPGGDRRSIRTDPRFSPGADTRSSVRVPASERATSARVVDRLTGDAVSIPWPPAAAPPSASSSPEIPGPGSD